VNFSNGHPKTEKQAFKKKKTMSPSEEDRGAGQKKAGRGPVQG